MEEFKEFQEKSLDEAIQSACSYFNAQRERLEIEIVQDAKNGIFGLVGVRKAIVKARRVPQRAPLGQIIASDDAQAPADSPVFTSASVQDAPAERSSGSRGAQDDSGAQRDDDQRRSRSRRGRGRDAEAAEATADACLTPDRADSASERPAREPRKPREAREERQPREAREERQPREAREERQPREAREERQPREAREERQPREAREERQPREAREERQPREAREERQPREAREERQPREAREERQPREAREERQPREAREERQPREERPRRERRSRNDTQGREDRPARDVHSDAESDDHGEGLVRVPVDTLDQEKLILLSRTTVLTLVVPILGPEFEALETAVRVEICTSHVEVHVDCGAHSGLLIGREGQTLSSLQYLASRMVSRGMGASVRVQLNVGDYRERQDDRLRDLALSLAERVRATGRSCSTRPMSSYHRRIIHLTLQDSPDVQTRSSGDGPLKRIIVQRRKSSVEPKTEE